MPKNQSRYSIPNPGIAEGKMDIGILGGTFDPIHNGHIAIAREAERQLNLSKVLLIPAGQPWLKIGRMITPACHRAKMVELAIATEPDLELSTLEIDRPGPSYAVQTMEMLQEQIGDGTSLFFIMGWDSLEEVSQWKEPARLIQMCRLAAFPRPHVKPPDLDVLDKLVPGIARKVILLHMPPIDISSTEIRMRIAHGVPVRSMVPPEVEKYIQEHKLYQA
jgi:nicotinate-nucleotide adenylyltransferase